MLWLFNFCEDQIFVDFVGFLCVKILYTQYLRYNDVYKYSFVPCSSRLWNSLPYQIVETTTANSFKSLLRDHYIGLNS